MTVNRKPSGRAVSIPAGLLWGLLFGWVITLLGALITAKLVDKEVLPEQGIGYGAMVTLIVSSFLSAKIAMTKIKRLKLQVSLMSGGLYLMTLMAVTALLFGGQYTAVGVTSILILCGCLLSVLPKKERKGRAAAGKYKIKR